MDTPSPTNFDPLKLGKRAQRIRHEKKLSIESLAGKAGVNKNTVVRFEKGLSTRIDTIYKICSVLEVSPFELIESKLIKERDYAIKKHKINEKSRHITRTERVHNDIFDGIRVGDLNYLLPGGQMSARVLEVSECGEPKTHPGEELLFCLTGTIGVKISDVKAILKKGDAMFFWGTEPHCYFNADKDKSISVALSVICTKN